MFCKKCGSQILEGNKFCNNCGTPVEEVVAPTVAPTEGVAPVTPSPVMPPVTPAQNGVTPGVVQTQAPSVEATQPVTPGVPTPPVQPASSSVTAPVPPAPGVPVNQVVPQVNNKNSNNKTVIVILVVVVLIIAVILGVVLLSGGSKKENNNDGTTTISTSSTNQSTTSTTSTTASTTSTTTAPIANGNNITINGYNIAIPSGYTGEYKSGKVVISSDTTGIGMIVGLYNGFVTTYYTQMPNYKAALEAKGSTNVSYETKTRSGQNYVEINFENSGFKYKNYLIQSSALLGTLVIEVLLVDVLNNPASTHDTVAFLVANGVTKSTGTFADSGLKNFDFKAPDLSLLK